MLYTALLLTHALRSPPPFCAQARLARGTSLDHTLTARLQSSSNRYSLACYSSGRTYSLVRARPGVPTSRWAECAVTWSSTVHGCTFSATLALCTRSDSVCPHFTVGARCPSPVRPLTRFSRPTLCRNTTWACCHRLASRYPPFPARKISVTESPSYHARTQYAGETGYEYVPTVPSALA